MRYSSIASSSFCGTLTNDCYRFLLEMHGQFLGTEHLQGQPHSQGAQEPQHSGSFSAFVRRLRPGFQGPALLCTLCRKWLWDALAF